MSASDPPSLEGYRAGAVRAAQNRLWPLYGAGFDNLGVGGLPLDLPLAHPSSDELLVRYDAAGACFSDVKVIRAGGVDTNRSVAAVAGMEGVAEGLHAVADGRFAGNVVIFPNLGKPLPLTPLSELRAVLPNVAARLDRDGNWTRAAEDELFNVML